VKKRVISLRRNPIIVERCATDGVCGDVVYICQHLVAEHLFDGSLPEISPLGPAI